MIRMLSQNSQAPSQGCPPCLLSAYSRAFIKNSRSHLISTTRRSKRTEIGEDRISSTLGFFIKFLLSVSQFSLSGLFHHTLYKKSNNIFYSHKFYLLDLAVGYAYSRNSYLLADLLETSVRLGTTWIGVTHQQRAVVRFVLVGCGDFREYIQVQGFCLLFNSTRLPWTSLSAALSTTPAHLAVHRLYVRCKVDLKRRSEAKKDEARLFTPFEWYLR